jgi:hypothetical protein
VVAETGLDGVGEHGAAVLAALAMADEDQVVAAIKILERGWRGR